MDLLCITFEEPIYHLSKYPQARKAKWSNLELNQFQTQLKNIVINNMFRCDNNQQLK